MLLGGGTGGGVMAVVQPGWALCIDSGYTMLSQHLKVTLILHTLLVSFSFKCYGLFTPNPKRYVLDVFRLSQCHVFQFKREI